MAGKVGPHGDPGWRREGDRRRGCFGAQGRRWRGWRASREQGEAARGVGVDREEVGERSTAARSDGNGAQRRRQCLVQEKKKGVSERAREGPQQP
jgi:hypothetical protein